MSFKEIPIVLCAIVFASSVPMSALAAHPCESSCSAECSGLIEEMRGIVAKHDSLCGNPSMNLPRLDCRPSQSRQGLWYLSSYPNDEKAGNYYTGRANCQLARAARRAQYICQESETQAGKAYVGQIQQDAKTVDKLGNYYSNLNNCIESLRNSDLVLLCQESETQPGKWYTYDFAKKDRIGSYFDSKADCLGLN